eukprot:g81927.t1
MIFVIISYDLVCLATGVQIKGPTIDEIDSCLQRGRPFLPVDKQGKPVNLKSDADKWRAIDIKFAFTAVRRTKKGLLEVISPTGKPQEVDERVRRLALRNFPPNATPWGCLKIYGFSKMKRTAEQRCDLAYTIIPRVKASCSSLLSLMPAFYPIEKVGKRKYHCRDVSLVALDGHPNRYYRIVTAGAKALHKQSMASPSELVGLRVYREPFVNEARQPDEHKFWSLGDPCSIKQSIHVWPECGETKQRTHPIPFKEKIQKLCHLLPKAGKEHLRVRFFAFKCKLAKAIRGEGSGTLDVKQVLAVCLTDLDLFDIWWQHTAGFQCWIKAIPNKTPGGKEAKKPAYICEGETLEGKKISVKKNKAKTLDEAAVSFEVAENIPDLDEHSEEGATDRPILVWSDSDEQEEPQCEKKQQDEEEAKEDEEESEKEDVEEEDEEEGSEEEDDEGEGEEEDEEEESEEEDYEEEEEDEEEGSEEEDDEGEGEEEDEEEESEKDDEEGSEEEGKEASTDSEWSEGGEDDNFVRCNFFIKNKDRHCLNKKRKSDSENDKWRCRYHLPNASRSRAGSGVTKHKRRRITMAPKKST